MGKILYRPLSLAMSVVGGLIAGMAFKQVWRLLGHQDDAPSATDRDRSWREILMAAAIEGALFGLVKAAVDRGGAKGFEKATGTWPGKE
jgi:hypothetical protein